MTEAKLDEVIKRYTDNAEYVRQRGDLEGCMEFRELAEFLEDCKKSLVTCEDAISREAVLNGLTSIARSKAKSDAQKSMMGRAIFFVEQLPPVTPKPLDNVLNEIRTDIEPKCDRINSLASVLPYTAHREIQELLCEIMNLCKTESEDKE